MYVCMYIHLFNDLHPYIKMKCVFKYRDELDESQIQYAVYDAVMGKQIYGHLESQGNLDQFFNTI
jgi:hypothetical protein